MDVLALHLRPFPGFRGLFHARFPPLVRVFDNLSICDQLVAVPLFVSASLENEMSSCRIKLFWLSLCSGWLVSVHDGFTFLSGHRKLIVLSTVRRVRSVDDKSIT